MQDDNLKSVTENLYKQNLELAVKNKTLSLLGKLYEISILTLEPKDLGKKINTTIQTDFNFELVGILLYNKEKDELSPLAFAESERFHTVQSDFKVFFENIVITNVSQNTFFKQIIEEKNMSYTENMKDVWDSLVPIELFNKIKSDGHLKSSILYPLIIENRVIGVLIFSLNRIYSDLVDYEKESIRAFINVIAVALDKALLYEQLKITNAELVLANEQQTTLIHFISHEIKGFLSKSRNIFSFILEEDYGPLPEYLKSPAKEGFDSGTKGATMVAEILSAADLKKGTIQYKMEKFDIKNAIQSVVSDLKNNADTRGLYIETKISENEDFYMVGDMEQIKHLLKNIIDNSIKYTLKGGLVVSLSKNNGKLLFTVKDTGVGIDLSDMPNIFDEGVTGKDSIKINVDSTGYGLFIAKKIAEDHHGRIWAESEGTGKGSTFNVELPQNQ